MSSRTLHDLKIALHRTRVLAQEVQQTAKDSRTHSATCFVVYQLDKTLTELQSGYFAPDAPACPRMERED